MQIAVGDAIRRILHDELNDLGILVEVIPPSCDLNGFVAIALLLIEPHPGAEHLIHQVLHHRAVLFDQFVAHSEHTTDVLRPFVARHAQRSRIACALRCRTEGLARAIGIDGIRIQCRRHIGRWHLDDLDLLDRHAFLREHFAQEQEIHGKPTGDRDALTGELLETSDVGIFAHHDDCTGAVPQRDDLHRDALVGQIHHQRRQHVGRLNPARHQRFFDLRPAAVFAVRELVATGPGRLVARGFGNARHRQGEIARDRQPADHQRVGVGLRARPERCRERGGRHALQKASAIQHVHESIRKKRSQAPGEGILWGRARITKRQHRRPQRSAAATGMT